MYCVKGGSPPFTHWRTVHLWQNDRGWKGGDRPAGENRSGSVRGMTWALRSPCRLSRRAHLLTTRKLVVVWPSAIVRPPGFGSAISFLLPVYTADANGGLCIGRSRADHRGLGGLRPPTSGTGYIPAHCLLLLSTPIMRVESRLRWWYTLLVLIQQIGTRPYKAKGT